MTSVEKIIELITAAGYKWPGGAANAEIHRTHAGRHQRACGAWSWFLWAIDGDLGLFPSVGSQSPVSDIVKGPTVVSWNKHTRSVELDVDTRKKRK